MRVVVWEERKLQVVMVVKMVAVCCRGFRKERETRCFHRVLQLDGEFKQL